MEVVLLWLDDLDDLVFAAALVWEPLRILCLQIGLLAALTLVACELSVTAADWSTMFAGVATSSVAIWFLGALLMIAARLEPKLDSVRA